MKKLRILWCSLVGHAWTIDVRCVNHAGVVCCRCGRREVSLDGWWTEAP